MAATIKDVSKATGLSLATISSYLNGGNVRKENKVKIKKAIEDLDFEINEIARGLKTNKTKTIGIIIPEFNSNFFAEICMEIEDLLREKGYSVIISDSRSNKDREDEAIDFLIRKRVDGMIIVPATNCVTKIKRFLDLGKPVVFLDRFSPGLENVAYIVIDNVYASKSAVQRLIDAGHTKIGMIIGPENIYTSVERTKGYIEAMKDNNILYNEKLIVYGNYTTSGGIEAMKYLIEQNNDMTAVLITNYEMTEGAVMALNELNVKIPSQLALIGFDTYDFARAVTPKLNIVIQPIEEIARNATKQILERLDRPSSEWEEAFIRLNTTFIEGKSI